jgi:hypothetical protein
MLAISWPSWWENRSVYDHQIRLACNDDFWSRYQRARADELVTDASGLGKLAISHAMSHGQAATEVLLRDGGGAQDAGSPQLERVEEMLTEHQRAHQLGHDNRGCIEVWLKVVAAFAFISVILSATAACLVMRPAATT